MNQLVLGIDPGLTGAFALVTLCGAVLAVEDLPVIRDGSLAWIDGNRLTGRIIELRNGVPTTAVVERVHAMPKNGSQAAFSQGMTLGSILPQLQLANLSIQLVTPGSWKRSLGLIFGKEVKDGERKRRSLDKARILFPGARAQLERQKDHGRAEALLIAHWYLTTRTQLRTAA